MSSDSTPAVAAHSAVLMDGTALSKKVRVSLAARVSAFTKLNPTLPAPCLAVILVGDRPDSRSYVKQKTKSCEEIGLLAHQHDFPSTISQSELIQFLRQLNSDDSVHGILVQLPVPDHINAELVLAEIAPDKDVDGLLEWNVGDLGKRGHKAALISCTPLGCMKFLDEYNIPIAGKYAVVVGRSNLVGKPVAQLLLSRDATVTICHSKTPNLEFFVKQADILIAAIGKAEFIPGSWIKPGAVVLDVGMNSLADPTKKAGYRLVGDVKTAEAKLVASHITPVPGGVGPMTVCMLLHNTLKAQEIQLSKKGIQFVSPPEEKKE